MTKKISGKDLLALFWTFFKIGLFTFGGGYAMIALIEREVSDKKNWITHKEMLDLVAIAETTPGVIALNTATFVGAKIAGFWGALAASIAVVIPSVIIISAIGAVYEKFGANKYVQWGFLGIRAAVAALILNAVFKMFKSVKRSWISYIVMGISFVLALLSIFKIIPVDIVFIILASALFGIVWGYFKRKKQSDNNSDNNKDAKNSSYTSGKDSPDNEDIEDTNKLELADGNKENNAQSEDAEK